MIDDLFSPARIEPLAPEPGASEQAWREVGRRRRKRTLRTQVLAGVALVALVMVGLLPSLDERGRVAELDVAGRDDERRITQLPPALTEDAEDIADPQRTERTGAGRTSSGAQPSESAEIGEVPAPRPGASAPAPGRPKPPVERTRRESIAVACVDWCPSAMATSTPEGYSLELHLCVAVGGRAHRFSYQTTQELDLRVDTAGTPGDTVWTWSVGQHFPREAHHLDVSPGECVTWTVLWDATDESGEPLPPGDYRLFAKSLADQAAARPNSEATFQIP